MFGGNWVSAASIATSSDINNKYFINNMFQSYDILFDYLQPRVFKYKDGLSNRIHTGFIAQEVANAIEKASLTNFDFAALCIASANNQETWSLRYEEFISLNTWQIQKLKSRVKILEDEIIELKKIIKG